MGVGGLKNCGSFVQNTVYRSSRSPRSPKWGVGGRQMGGKKQRGGGGESYRESKPIGKYNQELGFALG